MKAKATQTGGRSAARRGGAEGKVFVGFWTAPAVKAAINTRAKIDSKSASSLMNEIIIDWICGRRR